MTAEGQRPPRVNKNNPVTEEIGWFVLARTADHGDQMLDYRLRPYADRDAAEVDDLAVAAFKQFRSEYSDWPAMQAGLRRMSMLAEIGEIIVVEGSDRVIGAVAYIPPGGWKAPFFDASWPIIRMLIVAPDARGNGIGRALTEECIDRARRDGSHVIALHTSPIMNVALPMYLRMGFHLVRDVPPLYGVPYAVYLKHLTKAAPHCGHLPDDHLGRTPNPHE